MTTAQTATLLPRTQLALFEVEPARGGFQLIGPYQVTEDSISLFLLYLRALRRRPLTPEAPAEEFGPKGQVACQMVTTLYDKLRQHSHPRIKTFFSEWDRTFSIVYGQDLAKATRSAAELARAYGVTDMIDLKPLLFTVHTYYALLMKLLAAEFASLQAGSLVSSLVTELLGLSSTELIKEKLSDLEDGGLFNRLGIRNFLEGDLFGWYITAWDEEPSESVREMAKVKAKYEAKGKPLTEAGLMRVASYELSEYWVKQRRLTTWLDCGNCSKEQRRKCQEELLYSECPKYHQLVSLNTVVGDDGHKAELIDFLADDNTIDIVARLDARRFLQGFPKRLVQIGYKRYAGIPLDAKEQECLRRYRQTELKKYQKTLF